ncbi:transmembrane protein 80-like [Pungitius pungitius]|uniref:transmembrane protein 80-like n=1 Tax=Pungitius pungitius TaxID=134920 RepID=UPI002E154136
MAGPVTGRLASPQASVSFQLLLNLTTVYFVFYFFFTLVVIIRKSLVLSYPTDALVCDVCLLFLLAILEFLHFYSGVRGHLTESKGFVLTHLITTGTTILLALYFLLWQTYVMRVDVVLSGVLLFVYGLDGVMAFITLARLASKK